MKFQEAMKSIQAVLVRAGTAIHTERYDGLMVKKLAASNTLDPGRSNQTHIAITGPQMDIFPYLCADGYFYQAEAALKKYFVLRVPVTLYESNLKHLGYEGGELRFSDKVLHTSTTIVRSKRAEQADQLQVSMLALDGEEFVQFRRLIHAGYYFVLLKRKASMEYEAFGINAGVLSEVEERLAPLNNKFYKEENTTVVEGRIFNKPEELVVVTEENSPNLTEEDLGVTLKWMYDNAGETGKTAAIHMFGFKYGKEILENNFSTAAILLHSDLPESYVTEVNKGVRIYKSTQANEYGIRFYEEGAQPMAAAPEEVEPQPRQGKKFPLNCILYGAPGTGKTYSTAQYAVAMVENKDLSQVAGEPRAAVMARYRQYMAQERIVFTTFHQSYGYEDFIQGLRPVAANGALEFVPQSGVFKRLVDTATKDVNRDYVIIIDEINRANISKVFGELITLIEEDKRWGEENALTATLPSGDAFKIPNNVYILGTMNSADKSISLIDAALRRRFDFVEVVPNGALVEDPVLRQVLEKLNASLAQELGSTDLLVGHAYFMGKTEEDLCRILNRSIVPLLYEYFYDNSAKVKAQIQNILPSSDYRISGGDIGRLKVTRTM